MKLSWATHKRLEQFCKTVCTGEIGWNRQRRKDCRNNTMCRECEWLLAYAKQQDKSTRIRDRLVQSPIYQLTKVLQSFVQRSRK